MATFHCTTMAMLFAGVLCSMPGIVCSQEQDIQPPDVYMVTMFVHNELELIRQAMHKPPNPQPALIVRNAQPREVYFQAATLFLKAYRLCGQFGRRSRQSRFAPEIMPDISPPQDLRPDHVWNLVHRALGQLKCVKANLQLTQQADTPPRDASKTPTDVFKSVVQVNRQLNLLLERQWSPADVFAQVQLANDYATKILDRLAPVWRVAASEIPSYEEGRRPVDVYQQLFTCYTLIQQIAQTSDLQVLELEIEVDPSIVPSDVYDMASLVVSELRYFATLIDVQVRYTWRFTGRKVPSDVFQRARLLEGQLQVLRRVVQAYPAWHTLHP